MRLGTSLASCEPMRGQIPLPFPAREARILPMPVQRNQPIDSLLRQRAPALVQAIVEVLAGRRPPRQLEPWMTNSLFTRLQKQLGTDGRPFVEATARLASLHISEVTDGAAEIAGRMVVGTRSRAVALRLERMTDHRGHTDWRCTAIEWS